MTLFSSLARLAQPSSNSSKNRFHFFRQSRLGFTLEAGLNCILQITLRRIGPCLSDFVLIVNLTVIANHSHRVDQDNVPACASRHRVRDAIANVFEQRKLDPVCPTVARLAPRGVLSIGIDANDRHSALVIILRHLRKSLAVELRKRTLRSEKYDNNQFLVRKVQSFTGRP